MEIIENRIYRCCPKCLKIVYHVNERMRDMAHREKRLCYSCAKIKPKRSCSVDGCDIKHYGGGLCRKHWMRNRRHGDPNYQSTRGSGHKTKAGYIMLYRPTNQNSTKDGYVMEHVVVMSEHLGRPLYKHENVHHKNGFRDDNRLENLELWSTHQPKGQRVKDKITWAKELLSLYGEDFDG